MINDTYLRLWICC